MEAEQHKDLIVAAAFDQTVHFFIEIAEVHNPDRGVILDEIGNESIGITVFDDEDTACAVALQNRITVVAAQECLIFVPCFKIGAGRFRRFRCRLRWPCRQSAGWADRNT